MSSKSAMYRTEGKSPYGNSAWRGRSPFLIFTVLALVATALIWTTLYTRFIGERIQTPSIPETTPVVEVVK